MATVVIAKVAAVPWSPNKKPKLDFAMEEYEEEDEELAPAAAPTAKPASLGGGPIQLSPEQAFALAEFEAGKNVFLTGPGGTGKTELIKRLVAHGTAAGKLVQVCAMTGTAALLLNCGAKTVHSWAGIGLGEKPIHEIELKVMNNKHTVKRWCKTDVLIIDEISMMSNKIFDLLNELGQRTRKQYNKPFGGLQIIASGDFYQLPPVDKSANSGGGAQSSAEEGTPFCFKSQYWTQTFTSTVQLCKMFRQTDPVYADILNKLRVGQLTRKGLAVLQSRIGLVPPPGFKPTKMFPVRRDVDALNRQEYAALPGPEHVYTLSRPGADTLSLSKTDKVAAATTSASKKVFEYDTLTNSLLVDKQLCLKVGTQVMCVANLDDQIVNGSQGVVIGFHNAPQYLPIVLFNSGIKRVMEYNVWQSDSVKSVAVAQLPLIYAWGITIHKAQGTSLEMAEIDAGSGIFECGQTYVALSRVKSLAGLYLTALDCEKIETNREAEAFYKSLTKT